MSTNGHDVDPHALPADATSSATASGTAGSSLTPASASSAGAAAPPLVQGSLTRFLSRGYRIPFPPLERPLSFDDKDTWPEDPMRVFSQWYADSEQAYNKLSPHRMDAPVHWPNTMQIATVSSSGFPSVRTVLLKGFDPRGLIFFTNYDGAKGAALRADPRVALVFYWKTLERQVRFEGLAEPLSEAESDAYFHERPIQSQIGGVVSPQSRPIRDHVELERAYVRTVQGVAQQVQAHLEKRNESADDSGEQSAAELFATKQRVSELLSAMSLRASSGSEGATAADHSSPVASAGAADSASATHDAHAAALASLQKLEASPLTQPLLHSLVHRPPYWGGFLIRPLQAEFWCDGAYRLHSRIVYKAKDRSDSTRKAEGNTTADTQWTKTFLAP